MSKRNIKEMHRTLTGSNIPNRRDRTDLNSIRIDFLSKKITHRRKQISLKNESLAKALGLKKKTDKPYIIDATAGLAQDSFILACLGFEVTLLERSPIIHALLLDAFARAKQDASLIPVINRLHLVHADAIQYLTSLNPRPDIVYLDPMFPERKKSALNKKEMRMLQTIVGEDSDSNQLLQSALACALRRVVVKRPLLAEPLTGLEPSYCLKGSSNRFDIYIIK